MKPKMTLDKKIKLHIGGGNTYFDDWINIDNNSNNKIKKLDINYDLNRPLPFKDNSIDVIFDKHFFEKIKLGSGHLERMLRNYRSVLKLDGIFKITIPNLKLKEHVKTELKKIGFYNVEIFESESEAELVTDSIVVIDWMFPQMMPMGFRNMEINGLMDKMTNFNSYTMCPMAPGVEAWFDHSYGITKEAFNANRNEYLKIYPKNVNRLKYINPNNKYQFKLAYSYFLAETYILLPFYEKNDIPFVFTLYPGGGFGLSNKSSDLMLQKIFTSKCFRKVIVTQKVTFEYLLTKKLCPLDKIEYLFGGYVQFLNGEALPKKYYPTDKSTFDICFVASKYSERGYDKGYDLFIDVAKLIAKEFPDVRFHVVGNFDETDIEITEIKRLITFYGYNPPEFLKEFYTRMDICLSPNRPFALFEGNFDGFPLGGEALSCQTALFTTDELRNNDNFFGDDELVIIKPNVEDIVEKIKVYLTNLELLYKMSRKGQDKFYQIMDPEERMIKVANILINASISEKDNIKKI